MTDFSYDKHDDGVAVCSHRMDRRREDEKHNYGNEFLQLHVGTSL